MVSIQFAEGLSSDSERYATAVQNCTASLIKTRLEDAPAKCACASPRVDIAVGGDWLEGDFEVDSVEACCVERAAQVKRSLIEVHDERRRPLSIPRAVAA